MDLYLVKIVVYAHSKTIISGLKKKKSKLQILSFMFTHFCRRCLLAQKLTTFVPKVSKPCTFYLLGPTQIDFLVNHGHVN
ncbi:hypothetical protein Hanom_Chr11g00985291 [Helianthus anomalus]